MSSASAIGAGFFGSEKQQTDTIQAKIFGAGRRRHKKMGSKRHSRSRRHKIVPVPALVAGSRKSKGSRRRRTRKMV